MMMANRTTRRQNFIACFIFDVLVRLDGIQMADIIETEIKVNTTARIVRLGDTARDQIVIDIDRGTFLTHASLNITAQ